MKNFKKQWVCLPLLLVSVAAFAEVKEVEKLSQVDASIDADTLLILDIDNTLLEPAQTLGSDQWFHHVSVTESPEVAIERWVAVQKVSKAKTVEAGTAEWVSKYQKQGIPVMGLTARPIDVASATFRQLNENKIDFKKSLYVKKEVKNDLGEFKNGILFLGPTGDKGKTLVKFLEESGKPLPKKIIFVDDRAKNTKSVDEALSETKITHIEFRYGAADPKVKAFDHKITDRQWAEFAKRKKLLAD